MHYETFYRTVYPDHTTRSGRQTVVTPLQQQLKVSEAIQPSKFKEAAADSYCT